MSSIKFRFAPSPTGELQMGNLRTAFINWLTAKKLGGTLMLRIDDTDQARNVPGGVESIQRDLEWLGVDYEPHFEFQSKRSSLYTKIAEGLKRQGSLYECFCTSAQLEEDRAALLKMGKPPRYVGRCAKLTSEEVSAKKKQGVKYSWRLKVPESRGPVVWDDLVRGKQSFDSHHFGDFIVLREDGSATYNFASILDDMDLGITHVMRGEDHVSNTPRQILIAEAVATIAGVKPSLAAGCKHITFAHVPLVLASDKTKLSKRNGAKTAREYRDSGILPSALRNALALLCWAPPAGREILSDSELLELYEPSEISKSPSVFADSRLLWINSEHLKRVTDPAERMALAAPWMKDLPGDPTLASKLVSVVWQELSRLDEIPAKLLPILSPTKSDTRSVEEKKVAGSWLETFQQDFKLWQKAAGEKAGVKGKSLFMPLRRALTGQDHGIEITDLVNLLGEQDVKERLRHYAGL